ncbi:hypothetical protein [Streptomyces sp. NPDC052496]|uniref:hypothetical protein n=1 Tax=Streptomyces sp. NPDC052496 TaxID=3154951 RepID=UPI00341CC6CD
MSVLSGPYARTRKDRRPASGAGHQQRGVSTGRHSGDHSARPRPTAGRGRARWSRGLPRLHLLENGEETVTTVADDTTGEQLADSLLQGVGNEQMRAATKLLGRHRDGYWLRRFLSECF